MAKKKNKDRTYEEVGREFVGLNYVTGNTGTSISSVDMQRYYEILRLTSPFVYRLPNPNQGGTMQPGDDKIPLRDFKMVYESIHAGDVVETDWHDRSISGGSYDTMTGTVTKVYKNGSIMMTVTQYSSGGETTEIEPGKTVKINDLVSTFRFIRLVSPKSVTKSGKDLVTIDNVVIEDHKKDMIRSTISQVEHHARIFDEWGFGESFEKGTAISLLFWGVPGTGKTLMAQAIANHVGQELKMIQTADVESSEPGQCERNIKAHFENAAGKRVLLFDECDSLIAPRNEVGMILGAQINALLTALESYTGIVIFTTNRLGRMDPAFERRVSAKIEFSFPDESQRELIWKRLVPEKAPLAGDVDFHELSQYPMAGGNIKNAVLSAARMAAFMRMESITRQCFVNAIDKELEGLKAFEAAYDPYVRNIPRKDPDMIGSMVLGKGMVRDQITKAFNEISDHIDKDLTNRNE